jgi:hypothetical protein
MSPASARIERWATTHGVSAAVALEMFLERVSIMRESGGLSEQAAEIAALADMESHPECYGARQ